MTVYTAYILVCMQVSKRTNAHVCGTVYLYLLIRLVTIRMHLVLPLRIYEVTKTQ